MPVRGKACHVAGKVWSRVRECRYSMFKMWWCFPYLRTMDHTHQDLIDENCIHNDSGGFALTDEDNVKKWVENYARLLNVEFEWPSDELPEVSQMQTHPNPCQCVPDPHPQSTQQDEMWQGRWPIWHHSWDAESCWSAWSLAGKATGKGCFQQWWDPIRLAGEFHSGPLWGQGWGHWPWKRL